MLDRLARAARATSRSDLFRVTGRVTEVVGLSVIAEGFPLPVGSVGRIYVRGGEAIAAQVVGAKADRSILMPFREPLGVAAGDPVISSARWQQIRVGRGMLGCIVDGLGRPIGGNTRFTVEDRYPVHADPPRALDRVEIDRPLPTGIRAIDAMHTLGGGQRLGLFAGAGVGKSILLGMIARHTAADVIVAALIGERGREVNGFLRKDLGEEGGKRCVTVVSTSDESPVLRVRAAFTAAAIAEYFRDLGKDVLLLLDSATRVAMAQRQIGLAAGEPPATKGYPPSVFSLLPRLFERAGRTRQGSITGIYTVLVEGDDPAEPIADVVRGLLDGHVWLSRDLAHRGHYPAVSVLESVSRVMTDVIDDEHRRAAMEVRGVLAAWRDMEDLVNVGAYVPGANVEFDVAMKTKPAIDAFLRQMVDDRSTWEATRERLLAVARDIRNCRTQLESAVGAGVRDARKTA
jgi:FliI/YscN family ATPase